MQLRVYLLSELLDDHWVFALNSLCFHVIDCLLDSIMALLGIVNDVLLLVFSLILLCVVHGWAVAKYHAVSEDLVELVSVQHLFEFLLFPVLFHLLFFLLDQLFSSLFHKTLLNILLISYDFLFFDIVRFPRVLDILREEHLRKVLICRVRTLSLIILQFVIGLVLAQVNLILESLYSFDVLVFQPQLFLAVE